MDKQSTPAQVSISYDMARRLRHAWNPRRLSVDTARMQKMHHAWIHAQGAKYVYSTGVGQEIYILEFEDPRRATEFVLKYG